jgi:hypothetical protein
MGSPPPAQAGMVTGVLVPAYFYPGTGGTEGYSDGWAQMAAAAGQVPITAIFNPNSGPLPGPADPNYVTALTNLENAGGRVVAYVPSGFGSTPLGDPSTPGTIAYDIHTYITQYGSLIDSFFIDQMSVLPGILTHYQDIYNYIKSQGATYTVIGNPGNPFLNGVSPDQFLSTADVMNIFEGPNTAPAPGAPGFDAYPYGLNWFLSYPSSRFSNIVFDVPSVAAMLADVSKAGQLNAGAAYVTDNDLPNPYDRLPSYWNEEVSAIQSVAPAPGALTSFATGSLACLLVVVPRRWGRKR